MAAGDAASGDLPLALEGFTVGDVLGRGGFATVWEASPEGGGDPLAIKVGRGHGDVAIERFRREAEAMERIGPPFVPALRAHGRLDDGRPYLVMERLSGETLAARIAARSGPPDLAWVEGVGDALLGAIAAAHDRGLVHRDLKPENVFFAAPGDRLVLLDFGLTRHTSPEGEDLTRSGTTVGTPEYMAPEQLRGGRAIDARTDLYAFGVILYEMLTRRLPFVGAPAEIEHGHLLLRPRRPGELAPVPRPIEDLVLACLAKDPARRPASAAALRRSLAEACQAAEAQGPPSAAAPVSGRLIAEGRQPVIVAFLEASGSAVPVTSRVTAHGGIVPRQRGTRYVAVFSGMSADAPFEAALSLARELVEGHGVRAALHLADVTIRRRARGVPIVHGPAVDRPETWLPAEPWSGLVQTPDLARVQAAGAGAPGAAELPPAAGPPSVDAPLDLAVQAPLAGRGGLIEGLAASLARAFEAGRPALVTLIGEPGLGKTRLAAEAVALVRKAYPAAEVVHLAAAPPGAGERDRLTGQMLSAFREAPEATLEGQRLEGHHAILQALVQGLVDRGRKGPVAVILDDAQWADDVVLDALEYVTLDGSGSPIWVLVAAHPRFLALRRVWGDRTQHAERLTLAPLDPGAAAELAAALLAPVEYPPAAILDRLARASGGNPASLDELVRSLKRAGIVRRRPGGGAYYVATAELEALPPSPSWQWLAARRLAALLPELAACLRLGAVLGEAFSRGELEGVLAELEATGGAGTSADAGAALRALADAGLLARAEADEHYAFSNALFHDAVYELTDPAQREEVHRAALAYHRARAGGDAPPELLARIARHASAAGAREEAAAALLRLGDLAAGRHRHVEADQHYSAALAVDPEGDARRRALALGGRGRSRVHVDRVREAIGDLAAARALAASIGDDALVAELLLEEATALDWTRDFGLSAARVEEARPLVEAQGSPVLAARLLVADGRTAWRGGRVAESIELLERGAAAAAAVGDSSSRIVALLCLAWQLSTSGRLDDAEARFEEVIALTSAAGDLMHLCVAYNNRNRLWMERRAPDRAMADLRHAIALAREIGNPVLERVGCYLVAALLLWNERADEALDLARRGLLLEQRFVERRGSWSPLLFARIHLERGDHEEAGRLVAEVVEERPPDLFDGGDEAFSHQIFLRMLELALLDLRGPVPASGSMWEELVTRAEDGLGADLFGANELLEVLFWYAKASISAGRPEGTAAALARAEVRWDASLSWRSRFAALDAGRGSPRHNDG